MTQIIWCPTSKNGHYDIPNTVTSIGNYAFMNCSGLTEITLPNSLTSIGDEAFGECYDLTGIILPSSLTSTGNYAFRGCFRLTEITLPNSLTSIGDGAFDSCSGLTEIILPSSVTSIGYGAFSGCSGLTEIILPNSVTSIGDWVFRGCSSLRDIYSYGVIPAETYNYTFDGITKCTLHIPYNTLDNYKNNWELNVFDNVVEDINITGINDVHTTVQPATKGHYDSAGRKISSPVKGINIICYPDGTTRKVMVK